MVAEIKAKGSKSRRASGQTVRLRKRHWLLSGLKAGNKNVAGALLPNPMHTEMHRTTSSRDSESIAPANREEVLEVTFEDPWVRRADYKPRKFEHPHLTEEDDESFSNDKKLLGESSKQHEDDDDSAADRELQIKTYKRRFYILLLFSVIGFSQYCSWNTYGPIATTAKMAFGWSNTEIAVLASMDPVTYLCSMAFFSWLMDEKGLRMSVLVSSAFMFLGLGLRCVTSSSSYAIWSMGAGQLLNGLAGPVTQAAPTLVSATWFPPNQRTTSTAVSALCGSLGIALSFVIGPLVVKDIKSELGSLIIDRGNISRNLSETLDVYLDSNLLFSDSIYRDAAHYWPLDNLNISVTNTKEKRENPRAHGEYWLAQVASTVRDIKGNEEGVLFGGCSASQGVVNQSLQTDGKSAWANLGNFVNSCASDPSLCPRGVTVALWMKYQVGNSSDLQYFLGTSGTKEGLRGFLIFQDFVYDTEDHLSIKLENSTMLWKRSFYVPRDTWTHVAFTWKSSDGLVIYANGSMVGSDSTGKQTVPLDVYPATLTLGRPSDDEKAFSRSFYDEIATWDRKLHPKEIEAIFKRTADELNAPDVAKAEERLVKEGKRDIMRLLYFEFGVATLLFLLVIIYFPNKPPLPPSMSARRKRADFKAGAKQIIRNKQFWTLALVYGVTTGVYSGWGATLAVNLETFAIRQSEAGWIGFYATIAGIGAGLILARCADLFGGRMKALLLVLFFGASGCFLWFSLLCLRLIEFDHDALYKSSILGGFFVSGTIPLFYELTVESTYPVAEGVTTGALTLINNIFTVAFLFILMIPGVGTVWMNWCMFGACAGCIPIMLAFQEHYRRLEIDKDQSCEEAKLCEDDVKNTAKLKSPAASILSFMRADDLVNRLQKAKESNI